jgi:uncharacterized protein (DUF488 family)
MTSGSDVYTIGYGHHSAAHFVSLLQENSIAAVADVRSQPYSKSNPEFSCDSLRESLTSADIAYVFLGKELGARTSDERCYRAGKVEYDLLAATPLFQAGLARIEKGRMDRRIALMCAESDPLDCHRCILVGRHLFARDVPIQHILGDGRIEDHVSAMRRLIGLLRIYDARTHENEEDITTEAYRVQGERIAYRRIPEKSHQYNFWR